MVYKVTQKQHASTLFEGWQETMIWSCMQGMVDCLPPKYDMRMIGRELFGLCSQIPFREDFVAQHADSSMKGAYTDESYEG